MKLLPEPQDKVGTKRVRRRGIRLRAGTLVVAGCKYVHPAHRLSLINKVVASRGPKEFNLLFSLGRGTRPPDDSPSTIFPSRHTPSGADLPMRVYATEAWLASASKPVSSTCCRPPPLPSPSWSVTKAYPTRYGWLCPASACPLTVCSRCDRQSAWTASVASSAPRQCTSPNHHPPLP